MKIPGASLIQRYVIPNEFGKEFAALGRKLQERETTKLANLERQRDLTKNYQEFPHILGQLKQIKTGENRDPLSLYIDLVSDLFEKSQKPQEIDKIAQKAGLSREEVLEKIGFLDASSTNVERVFLRKDLKDNRLISLAKLFEERFKVIEEDLKIT